MLETVLALTTLGLLGVLLVGSILVLSLTPPDPTSSKTLPRPVVRMNETGSETSMNWGGCSAPNCRKMSYRCCLEYCGGCCFAIHSHLPNHKQAPYYQPRQSMLPAPTSQIQATCFCKGSIASLHTVHTPSACYYRAPRDTGPPQPPKPCVLTEVNGESEGLWPKWYVNKMSGLVISHTDRAA